MVSILTGTVEPRNLEKDKKEEDEETVSPSNKYNENYRMDRYNAGVVFGTRSELAAVRLNMNCDRQLQKLCRVVEANRRQCQKQFGRWEGELEIRAETLHKLRIATKLNTEDYNRLQKLYESGRIRPVTAGTTPLRPRSSSYRVIAQKARQLRLGSAEPIRSRGIEMPAPAFASALAPTIKRISREGRSTRQSRLHPPLHFSGIIAGPMNDRLRVTVVRGFRRVAPLCWQQSLPGAITIPPVPVPLVSHILPASQVSPFVTNLHPLNPEYRLIPQPPRMPHHHRQQKPNEAEPSVRAPLAHQPISIAAPHPTPRRIPPTTTQTIVPTWTGVFANSSAPSLFPNSCPHPSPNHLSIRE